MLSHTSPWQANAWPIYDAYTMRADRLRESNAEPSHFWDLADESIHNRLFKDWLNVNDLDSLLHWVHLYGLPYDRTPWIRQVSDDGIPLLTRMEKDEPTIHWCLDQATSFRSIWQFYQSVVTDPYTLKNCIYLWLNSECFPGKGFVEDRYYDEDNIEYWWSPEKASEEEWLELGAANFKAVTEHFNPFIEQAKQIEKNYRTNISQYTREHKYVSSSLRLDESSLYINVKPNRGRVLFVMNKQNCVFSGEVNTDLTPWITDWITEAQRAAFQLLAKLLSNKIKHIVHAVEVVYDDVPRLKQSWTLRTPLDALHIVLYKEMTQSSLVRQCPHPTCGIFFIPGRRDQASCGQEKCQKYVTAERKRRKVPNFTSRKTE
ncbi:MAG: hypothetical protein JSS83_26600 [Cyanobacteria bacterium SZAS LIN-3]|nr:hypothetical protein [Cyanobacteria bacterium SZAS LIN-3]